METGFGANGSGMEGATAGIEGAAAGLAAAGFRGAAIFFATGFFLAAGRAFLPAACFGFLLAADFPRAGFDLPINFLFLAAPCFLAAFFVAGFLFFALAIDCLLPRLKSHHCTNAQ